MLENQNVFIYQVISYSYNIPIKEKPLIISFYNTTLTNPKNIKKTPPNKGGVHLANTREHGAR